MAGHTPPAVQATQVPSIQTLPVPQDAPLGLLPEVTHTIAPVEHDVVPTLQGSLKGHAFPAAHATQTPALQTLSAPQAVPSWMSSSLSAQLIVGEHTVLPI